MGVPAFFAWWAKNYSNKILSTDYRDFIFDKYNRKILYFDLNGVIHPAVRTDGELALEDMPEAVIQYIIKIIEYVDPDDVYLAIDGVAPAAKMSQQRDRRYKSAKESKITREITMCHGEKTRDVPIDFNMISPGTEFMCTLQEHLIKRIDELTKKGEIWHKYRFTLNGAGLSGEGEHKIMDDIRANRKKGIRDFCLICGLDADLLFLTNINCPDAVLVRENVQFRGRNTTQFYDSETYPYLYLSVQELHDIVIKTLDPRTSVRELKRMGFKNDIIRSEDAEDLCSNTKWFHEKDKERLILDYAYICFFLGNDFIPHLPSLRIRNGSLNDIIVIYKKVCWALGGFLVNKDGMGVNRRFLREFLAELEYIEDELLEQLSNDRMRSITNFNRRFKQMPKLKQALEKFRYIEDKYTDTIKGGTRGWNIRYYSYFHDIPYRSSKEFKRNVLPICQDFINMTIWVLQYYQGKHNNWTMLYPHDAAPTVGDLYRYFDDIETDVDIPVEQPVTPFEQLMSILPPESSHLLPECLADYMTNPHSEIHYMYPVKVEFILQGNRFLYECKTKMPTIDRNKLKEIVDYTVEQELINNEEHKRNSKQDIIYINTA